MGNHDHDRMLVELSKERCIFGEEAFKRIRLGVVIQMTSIDIPMISMEGEIGEYKEKIPDVAKVDWSLIADREDNSNRFNKILLAFYRDQNTKVLTYQRWVNSGERVVVVVNLSGNFLVDHNEVHLDLAEREAKILVWLGDDWQLAASEPQPDSSVESTPHNNNTDTTETNNENS